MNKIDIDKGKLRIVNNNMPPITSSLSVQKRNINLLKWRIAPEIQNRSDLKGRLSRAAAELEAIENILQDIYRLTGSAISQYSDTETRLSKNASKFL